VSPKAVRNENPWLLIRLKSSLRIEHTFNPLQTDFGISIPRLGARIMPARGGIRGPVASMGYGWLDDHRKERPTVCRNTFNRSHHYSLDACASVSS
jgi:hypothetical protein